MKSPVQIGKGMCRIIVKSRTKRERLEKIPEVTVDGARVIFPEWMAGNISRIIHPVRKKKSVKTEQTGLFPDEDSA